VAKLIQSYVWQTKERFTLLLAYVSDAGKGDALSESRAGTPSALSDNLV
jgi:hypothetical protein